MLTQRDPSAPALVQTLILGIWLLKHHEETPSTHITLWKIILSTNSPGIAIIVVGLGFFVWGLAIVLGTHQIGDSSSTTSSPVAQRSWPEAPRPGPPRWHAQIYLQLASESAEQDATDRASQEAQTLNRRVCVFTSKKAFGIALGPLAKQEAIETLASLKAVGSVPEDAFVAAVDDSQIRNCYPNSNGSGN